MTVAKLKLVIEKLFRVKAAEQELLLSSPSATSQENISREDGKELRLFEVCDGCTITVGRQDAKVKAEGIKRAESAAEKLQQLRMERQEKGLQQLFAEEQRLMAGGGKR